MEHRIVRYRGKWAVYSRDESGSKRQSLGLPATKEHRAEAERLYHEYLAELRRTASRPRGNVTTDRCLSGYFEAHQDIYPRPSLLSFFSNVPIEAIDRKLCEAYAKKRAGMAPDTIKTELGILRSALRWAAMEGWIGSAPLVWRPEGSPPRDRWLTTEEANSLIAAAKAPHVALFIRLALMTGARSGAILDLTWDRVSFDLGRIDFNKPGSAKTRKRRAMLPISEDLRQALDEAKKGAMSDFVVEFAGKKVGSIKNGFRQACVRAGLKGVTPHTLRHTAATWAAQAGVDMWEIAGMLGHASTRTTEAVYAKHHPDHLKGATSAVADRMRSAPQVQMNTDGGGKDGTSMKTTRLKSRKV